MNSLRQPSYRTLTWVLGALLVVVIGAVAALGAAQQRLLDNAPCDPA